MKIKEIIYRPAIFRHLMNLWPPFVGAGIGIEYIAPDWRELRVGLKLRFYNHNNQGTHFGGNLFAMTDPFLVIMLMRVLGDGYRVWDQQAQITFLKPGISKVTATFQITDEVLTKIRLGCQDGKKHLEDFQVDIRDTDGQIVASVNKVIYLRHRRR